MADWPTDADDGAFAPPAAKVLRPTEAEIRARVVMLREGNGLSTDEGSIQRVLACQDEHSRGIWRTPEEERAAQHRGNHLDEDTDEDACETLLRRVFDDADPLLQAGIYLESGSCWTGHLELEYFAETPSEAARVLRDRYGSDALTTWLGPRVMDHDPHPFGSWSADGNELTVFYGLPRNGEAPGRVTAEEFPDRIEISLTIQAKQAGLVTLAGGFKPSHATVTLSRQVGDRAVIDTLTGERRPRWRSPTR
jgi:hypothetical protein